MTHLETEPVPVARTTVERRRHVPVRWMIAVLLLLLSMLNYIDRQAMSILATTIQSKLELSDLDYAHVGQAFLLCYTLAYFVSGRIVDRYGARLAETGFVIWWSTASMLTAAATGLPSLIFCRGLLGLGEPGHYAAAAKVVGEWFPPREKGIAAGMYMMGGTLGAAVAAPLVAGIAIYGGWQSAMIVTGALGWLLAIAWWICYRSPQAHPWLGAGEIALLDEHGLRSAGGPVAAPPPISVVLRWRPLWYILVARMLTDPAWYFYLVWFAKYLQEHRGYTLADVGMSLWIVFLAADLGCLAAGWISGRWIARGANPARARLATCAIAAVGMSASFLTPILPGPVWPIVLGSLFAGCIMLFMASCVTLPLDLFPSAALGTTQGVIGMGGAIGGFISTGLIGWALTTWHSYDAIFLAMSGLHAAAVFVLWRGCRRQLAT